MHVISRRKLKDFYTKHSDSKAALLAWYNVIAKTQFDDPAALRAAFPQVDYVKPYHVFNVGQGYRLVAAVHFRGRKVFVRHVMTHSEYDRGKWKRE